MSRISRITVVWCCLVLIEAWTLPSAIADTAKVLGLKAEISSIESDIRKWEVREKKEDEDWAAFRVENDNLNARGDAVDSRRSAVKTRGAALYAEFNSYCVNDDHEATGECTAHESRSSRIKAIFAELDELEIKLNQLSSQRKQLVAERRTMNQRADKKRATARETVKALNDLRSKLASLEKDLAKEKSKRPQLTDRTRAKLKEFMALQSDMAEMQKLANALIAIAPLRMFLDGVDPDDVREMYQTDEWEFMVPASRGLSSHYRNQLKFFCQAEAISSANNATEKRFWQEMSKAF